MAITIITIGAAASSQDSMTTLADVAQIEVASLLGAFAIVIAWQLLTGRINTRGLLAPPGENGASGNNVQLLFVTFATAGYYLMQVPQFALVHKLPPVSDQLLLVFVGSHVVFTGTRALPLISSLTEERKDNE